jgi:hypothetical protein
MTRRRTRASAASPSADRDAGIDALTELASSRATRLGHVVGPWAATEETDVAAWRATCRRCGAVGYIREEHGLRGVAGRLCSESCPALGAAATD